MSPLVTVFAVLAAGATAMVFMAIMMRTSTQLDRNHRERLHAQWAAVQARFVNDPAAALQDADELVLAVMRTKGMSLEDDTTDALVLRHYHAAHALADASRRGRASAAGLRVSMAHYRFVINGLLAPESEWPDYRTQLWSRSSPT